MGYFSSRTLIQAHALFLFILAVYLTHSPEVITESDIVHFLGEAMKVDVSPILTRPQSPFALCGILLVADALVDLIIVTKVPQINEIMAAADALSSRSSRLVSVGGGSSRTMAATIHGRNPFMTRIAALYSEIWALLAASRFCLFFAVSFFVYQSKSNAWGILDSAGVDAIGSGFSKGEAASELDRLKNRVVFTYGLVEMVFWLWILLTLRDERREMAARLMTAQAITLGNFD